MASVRPFKFTGLPHYKRDQIALTESFAAYLSFKPYQEDLKKTITGTLERYLKTTCELSEINVRPIAQSDVKALLPEITCLALLGCAPHDHKIIVDIDIRVAFFVIDRLLGGQGVDGKIKRALTDIEEGALSFLILHLLNCLQDGLKSGKEIGLCLDSFACKIDDIQTLISAENNYQLLDIRLAIEKRIANIRVLIPQTLATKSFSAPVNQYDADGLELSYMRSQLQKLGSPKIAAHVEIAELDLNSEDIANLGQGDIILLENHQLEKTVQGIAGSVFVKIGQGANGGLRAALQLHNDHYRLTITEIVVQQAPEEGSKMAKEQLDTDLNDMSEVSGVAEIPTRALDDNMKETQGLLRDVSAPVVVELARIPMNTSQVIRLRAGQILRLPRGPNDPVDMVVHGKVFARGELIDVDGELGVRILQIAGKRN